MIFDMESGNLCINTDHIVSIEFLPHRKNDDEPADIRMVNGEVYPATHEDVDKIQEETDNEEISEYLRMINEDISKIAQDFQSMSTKF
jgi:hypothetical protein